MNTITHIVRRLRYIAITRQVNDLKQSIHEASIKLGKKVQEQQAIKRKLTEAEQYAADACADHWTSFEPF